MSSFVCSDHTILAIVEGMRKYGLVSRNRAESKDMCEALRLVNEYMTSKRYSRHEATGRYFIECNHREVTAIPRDYTDGETIAAIECYLYQVETGEAMDFDFITLVSAVKMLRDRITEANEGIREAEDMGHCRIWQERDEWGKWHNVTSLYEWDLTE